MPISFVGMGTINFRCKKTPDFGVPEENANTFGPTECNLRSNQMFNTVFSLRSIICMQTF